MAVANLNKSGIIRFFRQMKNIAKESGIFILSGTLDEEENEVSDYPKKMDVKCVSPFEDQGWSCIVTRGGRNDN